MGSTVITLYDRGVGAVIGTKTVTLLGPDIINRIDFTTDLMDSGTNEFNGQDGIILGLNPSAGGGDINYSIIYERGL